MSARATRGPDFVVIGAQKCGTTTLYEDLRNHPHVRLAEKESTWLIDRDRRVARSFTVEDGHLAGEVSTSYTMLPAIDAASSAKRTLSHLKVIYIVRDPIARTLSHHHHHVAAGLVDRDVDAAVRSSPELVDNSRYAMQLRPWIEAYGRDQVYVIHFERYTADRQEGARAVHGFLGLEPRPLTEPETRHNDSTERRMATGWWRDVRQSAAYRTVRPLIPQGARKRLSSSVLPPPAARPDPPSKATVRMLLDELKPEVSDLQALVGGTWWDLEATWGARA